MDHSTMAAALEHPGADTRQWVSYGIVQPDTTDTHSVSFLDAEGNPLPNGILVLVKLEPSGSIVMCRVGMRSAGAGEAEYDVIGPGDEVLVAIPEGDERAGCVIICKFSNASDAFPSTVGGVDVTQNNISFKRIVTPYIMETGGSYLLRQAKTGASFSIDPTGNIMISDGEGDVLSLSQNVLGLQESSGGALLQIDPSKKTVTIQSSASTSSAVTLTLDDGGGTSTFMSGGVLQITTAGGGYAFGHAVTLEQLIGILANFIITMNSQAAWNPVFTAAFALNFPNPLIALMELLINGAANGAATPQAVVPGGNLAELGLAPTITAALTAQLPDPTGLIPGIGRAGLQL